MKKTNLFRTKANQAAPKQKSGKVIIHESSIILQVTKIFEKSAKKMESFYLDTFSFSHLVCAKESCLFWGLF